MIFDDADVYYDCDDVEDENEKDEEDVDVEQNLSNAFSDFCHILAQPQRIFSSFSQGCIHLVQSRLDVARIIW